MKKRTKIALKEMTLDALEDAVGVLWIPFDKVKGSISHRWNRALLHTDLGQEIIDCPNCVTHDTKEGFLLTMYNDNCFCDVHRRVIVRAKEYKN